MDERGGGRLAVGAGNADDLVRGERGARLGEEFDVADDRHARSARVRGDRVAVERHARGHDQRVEPGEVDSCWIGKRNRLPLPFRGEGRGEGLCCGTERSACCSVPLSPALSPEGRARRERGALRRIRVPRRHPRATRQQRTHARRARACEPQHSVAPAAPERRDDHRSFNVESPASASTSAMIQKRITTVGSLQPSCSKWWWIGAILNTRLPVRL